VSVRVEGRRADLVIAHQYPDLLQAYGDRGNVITLARRAEWRGFSVRVLGVSRGERIEGAVDLIVIGGGSDRVQALIGADLAARRQRLAVLVRDGTVVLGVCGGYQLLGHRYVGVDGFEVEGLGLLDVTTMAAADRIVGRMRARGCIDGEDFALIGFENHAGRTTLGPAATALAQVRAGQGNNGRDRTEGAVQGNVIGTYLHGPVLPSSPRFADLLLERALARTTGGAPLPPLHEEIQPATGPTAG